MSAFSVRSTYLHLVDGGLRMNNWKLVWRTKCPLKVRAFLQLASKDVFLTWPNFQRRGWTGPGVYSLCGEESETISHLLLMCTFSLDVWQKVLFLWESTSILQQTLTSDSRSGYGVAGLVQNLQLQQWCIEIYRKNGIVGLLWTLHHCYFMFICNR